MGENFGLLKTSLSAVMNSTQSDDLELDSFLESMSKKGDVIRVVEDCSYSEYVEKLSAQQSDHMICDSHTKAENEQATDTHKRHCDQTDDVVRIKRRCENTEENRQSAEHWDSVSDGSAVGKGLCEISRVIQRCNGENTQTDDMISCDKVKNSQGLTVMESLSEKPVVEMTSNGMTSHERLTAVRVGTGEGLTVHDIVNCFVDREVVELVCEKLKEKCKQRDTRAGTG